MKKAFTWNSTIHGKKKEDCKKIKDNYTWDGVEEELVEYVVGK